MNPMRKVSMTKNLRQGAAPSLLVAALVLCAAPRSSLRPKTGCLPDPKSLRQLW